ncbi:MAG: glycosyltransferase family 2 protein, partial [Fibrobacteres bacterium]|nr:glycosyltransferase family 2 protein [Fibrobacterota bacterium]
MFQIQKLIASLEKQTLPLNMFETIISDDGSTDGTAEYLGNYKGALKLKSVIPTAKGSRAKARNSGLTIATGTHILFLDGDLEVHHNLVETHFNAHKKDRNAVYIGKVEPCSSQRNDILNWYRVSRGGQKIEPGK